MGLLENHMAKLEEIRHGLDGTPGLRTCWLLSYQNCDFENDTDPVRHIIGDSRHDAYRKMVDTRNRVSFSPFGDGYVYIPTWIGGDEIPEESGIRTVSANEIWHQVYRDNLVEPGRPILKN